MVRILLKVISLLFCAVLLSHCANLPNTVGFRQEQEAEQIQMQMQVNQKLVSPYTMSESAYLALAKNQTGSEKQSLLLAAAGRSIFDGRWREGRAILSQTSDLNDEQANERRLLLAKIDLIRERPRVAIDKLARVSNANQLPIYFQVQYHQMLAQAYQSVGHVTASISERIKLEHLLPDELSKAKNRRALWLALTLLPIAELNTLVIEATDGTERKGWLQLALISRKHYADAQKMLVNIEQWQEKYPDHPGLLIMPSPPSSVSDKLFARPKHIALLLPLTGPLAGPGGAVKDGFMAGLNASKVSNSTSVRFYNTDNADVEALYLQAITDGADYIIGPLSKANVATVARMNHPVPTLLLNEADSHPNERAYQFGLSPTNEARQVAVKARSNGYARALVIAPSGSWGDDVTAAFSHQWRANGGRVVDTLHYGENDDLSASMRQFLRVTDSEMRGKQLKQLLGQHIESTQSRRQDFDVVFLLAYPSKARQIMPLLKYYFAGDVPVYATSAVYAGGVDVMKDRDLNGIIFCDMPWVFTHQMGRKNWPEQYNSYNRLYALGLDSFALSTQLNQLLLFPVMGITDKSGVLHLTRSQQIVRILAWGQFNQGMARISLSTDNHSATPRA